MGCVSAVFISVALGVVLLHRNTDYESEAAIWQDTIARAAPRDARAHYNLGVAFSKQGHTDDAIACFRDALSIKPDYADAHDNLGVALAGRKQFDEAIAHTP